MSAGSEIRERLLSDEETCPEGGRHFFRRQVRDHPEEAGRRQDAMLCEKCSVVLYDWKTMSDKKKR